MHLVAEGAVLSQNHSDQGKLHPCAYYLRKLMATETNYDVGNRELLSIKAALEEWRHWLEGAFHPFLVLTNHCILEYLCGAKCLNPHQPRWALFFTRFRFSVTYCWVSRMVRLMLCPCSMTPGALFLTPNSFFRPQSSWLLSNGIWWKKFKEPIPRNLHHPSSINYGLPEDIVSDRGPQFTSQVWQAFCNQLGLNISLSSGYHTQSNGQAERLNQKIGIGSSDHTAAMNNTAGVSSYPGQNTPRIPSHIPPLVSCHFSAFCDISHRYFHGLGNLRMSPWLTNGQDEVEKSGNVHMCICKGRRTVFMVFKEVEQGILFEPVGKVTPVYLSDRGKKPPSLLWSFPLRLRPRVAAAPERDQEKPCLTEPDLERHCSADSGAVLELPALAEAGTE
ncbi:hypothetical protein QTP86_024205 [Hemibagrus guttatus]|nr:hypothetical protein QTP86_024205 [Hemibagrus guttatus]